MKNAPQKSAQQAGFTLIELSIVLVIIGLIVGGILVGQDMIKAATIRSVTKQIEGYNTAFNTFRDKYGAIPGDATPTRVTQFSLPGGSTIRSGGVGTGDGDGLLRGCTANAAISFGCESAWVWNDLSFAQLIPDNLNNATNAPTAAGVALTTTNNTSYLPKTRLRDSALLTTFPLNGRNYYYLGSITSSATAYSMSATVGKAVTVREANDIDTKVDDGGPTTGSVIAQDAAGTTPTAAAAATGVCVATGPVYNTANNGNFLEEQNCALAIRQQ